MIGGIVLAFALGYGIASKDIMTNFIVSLLQKHKFKKGDHIKVGNHSGIVTDGHNFGLYTYHRREADYHSAQQIVNR
ncbi:hypothetical protein MASR1M65_19500 [Saprospiraceae bacterium]